jgi:hypothetical protein
METSSENVRRSLQNGSQNPSQGSRSMRRLYAQTCIAHCRPSDAASLTSLPSPVHYRTNKVTVHRAGWRQPVRRSPYGEGGSRTRHFGGRRATINLYGDAAGSSQSVTSSSSRASFLVLASDTSIETRSPKALRYPNRRSYVYPAKCPRKSFDTSGCARPSNDAALACVRPFDLIRAAMRSS